MYPKKLNELIGKAPPASGAWNALLTASSKLSEHIDEIPDMLVNTILSMARRAPDKAFEFFGDVLATTATRRQSQAGIRSARNG